MNRERIREIAEQAEQACEELDVGVLGDDDACTAKVDSIESAIRQALTEALGPATDEMHEAAAREWDGRMSARSAGVWTAMAAVRLRDVLSGAKE